MSYEEVWVACHPIDGVQYRTISNSKTTCENIMLRYFLGFHSELFAFAMSHSNARELELNRALRRGWQIRKGKLIKTKLIVEWEED
jgi:hypothetical protein